MNNQAGLRRSWVLQRRVIYALFMREVLTRFGRHNIGFLWMFVEPMIFTLAITALWTAMKSVHSVSSVIPITAFAITGYSPVLLWRNMPTRCIAALQPNLSLLYHRHVRPIDIFFARVLLEAAGATISFMALSILFISIGWIEPPEDILQVIGGWMMIAWFGASLGILTGALSHSSETVEKLWHPTAYILFPLSGAAFMVGALPASVQHIILYLPMIHGVEFIREGYFGSKVTAHYDMAYMALFNLGLTLLGQAQLRKISRVIVPEN